MALIHCPECQKEVSSVALACPQCAFPYPGRRDTGNGQLTTDLRTCPDCKRIISSQAQLCPHCGAPPQEAPKSPDPVPIEGGETVICPHCGISFTRGLKAKTHAGEGDALTPIDENVLAAQSRIGLEIEDAGVEEELPGNASFSATRRRRPLWEQKQESHRDSPRHSRPKNRWNTYLVVILVILLLAAGWAIWEMRDMSGLEALVYWNR